MKTKSLVFFLVLALASWAQTSTPSSTDKPGDTAAAKCACCEKMAASADHKACCHTKKAKAGETCCGKDGKSCCGDAAQCVRTGAAKGATASCCSGKGQCGANGKACCGDAMKNAKMECCGKQCGMHAASPTAELRN